jgi:hypothetical protein
MSPVLIRQAVEDDLAEVLALYAQPQIDDGDGIATKGAKRTRAIDVPSALLVPLVASSELRRRLACRAVASREGWRAAP